MQQSESTDARLGLLTVLPPFLIKTKFLCSRFLHFLCSVRLCKKCFLITWYPGSQLCLCSLWRTRDCRITRHEGMWEYRCFSNVINFRVNSPRQNRLLKRFKILIFKSLSRPWKPTWEVLNRTTFFSYLYLEYLVFGQLFTWTEISVLTAAFVFSLL